MLWQFRIHIDPSDPKEVIKAADALAEILALEGLETHILITPGKGEVSAYPSYIDGTIVTKVYKQKSDKDYRCEKISFFVKYCSTQKQFEKTPEQIKNLLLRCWKALQKAKVKVGYLAIPHGDLPIPAVEGISLPFSMTCNKRWWGRRGNLGANPNDFNFPKPSQGIIITYEDVRKYQISYKQMLEAQKNKIQYLEEHNQFARETAKTRLKELHTEASKKTAIKDVLANLEKAIKQLQPDDNPPELLKSISKAIAELKNRVPYNEDNGAVQGGTGIFQTILDLESHWQEMLESIIPSGITQESIKELFLRVKRAEFDIDRELF